MMELHVKNVKMENIYLIMNVKIVVLNVKHAILMDV
jgi:hypothetical protein